MKKLAILAVLAILCINAQAQNKNISTIEAEKNAAAVPYHDLSISGLAKSAAAFFTEDFAGGLPAGWAIIDSVAVPIGEIWEWSDTLGPITVTAGADSFSTNGTSAGNGYMIYNSDHYGNNSTLENTSLISPPINCTGQNSVHLGFNQYYRDFSNSMATIFVSVDSINWTEVANYDATTSNPEATDIDITAIAANQDSVYLRFRYTGSWGWYWMLDDIQLSDSSTIGLNENKNNGTFLLYPNPSTGIVTITTATSSAQNIIIYNVKGEIMYEKLFANTFSESLDLSQLAKGFYTVKVIANDKIYVQRLVLTK